MGFFRKLVPASEIRYYLTSTPAHGSATMSQIHRITASPDVCGGRPCIRNLRIRVTDLLEMLAAGADRQQILESYPYLEAEDITAALEFAARHADHPVLRVA